MIDEKLKWGFLGQNFFVGCWVQYSEIHYFVPILCQAFKQSLEIDPLKKNAGQINLPMRIRVKG